MTVKLVQIGNARVIEIPSAIIDKYSLDQNLEIIESKDGIFIKAASSKHKDWDQKFRDAKTLFLTNKKYNNVQTMEKDYSDPEWI